MKSYTVTIETSVLVTADDLYDDESELTPKLAAKIAVGWAEESLGDSNAHVTVRETDPRPDVLGPVVAEYGQGDVYKLTA